MEYLEANYNPTGKKTGDCVVRAIMIATKQSWRKVYGDLCAIGLEMFAMPNEKKVYAKYLETLGWKKQKMPKDIWGYRYPIHRLANKLHGKTIIVSVANHLTVVKDEKLIDIWDCSRKCVGNYWIK